MISHPVAYFSTLLMVSLDKQKSLIYHSFPYGWYFFSFLKRSAPWSLFNNTCQAFFLSNLKSKFNHVTLNRTWESN